MTVGVTTIRLVLEATPGPLSTAVIADAVLILVPAEVGLMLTTMEHCSRLPEPRPRYRLEPWYR